MVSLLLLTLHENEYLKFSQCLITKTALNYFKPYAPQKTDQLISWISYIIMYIDHNFFFFLNNRIFKKSMKKAHWSSDSWNIKTYYSISLKSYLISTNPCSLPCPYLRSTRRKICLICSYLSFWQGWYSLFKNWESIRACEMEGLGSTEWLF